MICYRICFSNFHFVPGVILGHFRYPKSACRYQKVEHFKQKCKKKCFGPNLDFSFTKSISRPRKTLKTWKIPICYDEEFAIDLNEVSDKCKLDKNLVKKRHKEVIYDVDFIGFLPGFLYLRNLDKSLYFPRKKNPRTHIPKGSVGIAGNQTGIYNTESPGGWNIIGRTPMRLFDKLKDPPIKIKQGDKIIFKEISRKEFNSF